MEDRYPPNANQGRSPAQRQNNNVNAPYVQNTPHSVSAARAANKSSSDPQSGTAPFYSGAINWMTSPNNDASQPMTGANTGVMPSAQDKPNSGTMGAMQNKQNTGTMPSSMQSNPNSGTMGAMQNKQNTGTMPSSMQSNPNSGTMGAMQGKQDTGMMPYAEDKPKAGVMPYSSNQSNAGTGVESEMTEECSYKMGTLPSCAPLSAGFVPWQQENPPKYSAGDALTRGTLFPGLDLPYLNMVNQDHPYAGTPLGELMALGFVIKELNLYLDTHPKDREALMMLQSMNKLMAEGTEKYTRMYGPITISNIVSGDEFTWINNPWPWDYNERPVAE